MSSTLYDVTLHCTWYRIAFRGAVKSSSVWYEQQGLWVAQVVHTHQTSCRLSRPRGFGALNSSPHSWIFTSVSVGSSPRCYLFTSVTDRIGVHTAPKCDKKPFRYVTLHFRDRRGAASLRHRSLTATTVLVCEQEPYPVWFSWWCKSYPVHVVDISLDMQWRGTNVHKRLDARAELLFWLLNPLRPPMPSPSWLLNPLSRNSDQHQFSPNDIHTLSRSMVMRITKMITKVKMPWTFIKFSQPIL